MSLHFAGFRPDDLVTIRRSDFTDARLSYAAKGVYATLCVIDSPCDPARLADLSRDDADVVRAALDELQAVGLISITDGDEPPLKPEPITPTPIAERPQFAQGSVVYYLRRRADQAVKIGFTASLPKRVRVLSRDHGPLDLLATEPGGWHLEHKRHEQFNRWRIDPDREWFRPGAPILRHVRILAASEVSA
jgi:hypothetical protein